MLRCPRVSTKPSQKSPSPLSAKSWKYLLLLIATFVYFNAGADWMRAEKGRIKSGSDFAERASRLFWPPWRGFQLYVSHESDEHLYFEFSRLILGEDADLGHIARQTMGDTNANLTDLQARVKPGPGLRLPYRDVSVGYPPVGVLAMLVPRLAVSTLPAYRLAFGFMMGALYLLTLALGWRLARRCNLPLAKEEWLWRGLMLLLAVGPIIISRFDVVPALLTLCVVLFLAEQRPYLAGLFFVAGVAAKMFPLLLMPTWVVLMFCFGGQARQTIVRMCLFLGALAVGGAVSILLLTGNLLPLLADTLLFRSRPFQIESTVGSILLALSGSDVIVGSFGSHNVDTPLGQLLAQGWEAVMLLSVVGVAGLAGYFASRHRHLGRAQQNQALVSFTVAALLAMLCTSKILSAQYPIWCVPLVALLPQAQGRRIYQLFCLALVLTQLEFPILYGLLLAGSPPVVAVLVLRNVLLWVLLGLTLRTSLQSHEGLHHDRHGA